LFGLVPVGDRMRISGSAEITGYDATPAQARADAIIANTTFTFPSLAAHYRPENAKVWAGLRPVTPAGTPLIGRTAIEGVWINAGHGHLGWTLACGSGRALAALVDGGDAGLSSATQRALTSQRSLCWPKPAWSRSSRVRAPGSVPRRRADWPRAAMRWPWSDAVRACSMR
jgi:glycine/D-amino acid oxidase-like deaminating enzyme